MNELPKGWCRCVVSDVAEVVGGATPRTSDSANWGDEYAWITPDDLSRHHGMYIERGARSLSKVGLESCSATLMPAGSVLYSSRAPIGYVAVSTGPVCTNQGFKSFIPGPELVPEYLYWYLKHITPHVLTLASGTTFMEISKKVAAQIPLILPPTDEQQQIVRTIHSLFERIDVARTAMTHAHRRVQMLRRASGSNLLAGPWRTLQLGEITDNHDGRRIPLKRADRDLRDGGYPYYGASGIIDSIDDYIFDGNYLLIAEDGANLVTRSKPIAFIARGRFWVNNHAHVVSPIDNVRLEYLRLAVDQLDIQRSISGSAQPKLTQASLNRLQIPVPPLVDQDRIISTYQRLTSVADALEDGLVTLQTRAHRLRSSVLAAAFSGQLVSMEGLSV